MTLKVEGNTKQLELGNTNRVQVLVGMVFLKHMWSDCRGDTTGRRVISAIPLFLVERGDHSRQHFPRRTGRAAAAVVVVVVVVVV